MLKITVDNKEIKPNTIWYHYQKVPRPGGHNYYVKISLDEIAVSSIQKMIECPIGDSNFFSKAIQYDSSSGNLIDCILIDLPEDQKKNRNIEWVFNTIDEVELQDNFLIIKGRCSESRPELFR